MDSPLNIQLDQLRNTLGKMEVAFSALRDAIIWTDQSGRVQWCNQAFFSMVGKSRISLIGKELADVLPLQQQGRPVPREKHPARLIHKPGDDITSVYGYIKDEHRFDIEISATCIWEKDASACSVIMIVRDISELQVADEIRTKSAALAAAASAIVITDHNGLIEWVNLAFQTMSGYTLEESVGRPFGFQNPTRQKEDFWREVQQTLERGNLWEVEFINLKKDGAIYQEKETITEVANARGEIRHYIAIKENISERKHFEAMIIDREARIQAILGGATDSIIIIDEQGEIQSFNDAALAMFGYDRQEMVGQNVRILMPEPHRSAHDGYLLNYLLSKRKQVIGITRELQAVRKDGSLFPIELSLSEAKIGESFLFSGFIRDITKRVESQEELAQAHADLLIKQKLINADLLAAAGIQVSLLPQAQPETTCLEAAWKFQPSTFVGGDIFNFFQLDADNFIAYMVDVSGHGVPSALISVSIYQTLSPHSSSLFGKDDNKVLAPSRILDLLEQEFPIERFNNFFTIFFMTINLRTGVLTYSAGGHPPALLLRNGAEPKLLEAGGMIIGAGAPIPFAEACVPLQKGDKIIMYTDGTYEYQNENQQMYGLDRLFATTAAQRENTIEEAIDGIFEDILNFGCHLAPQDDISLLGFEYK